jgi:hypothetical protein
MRMDREVSGVTASLHEGLGEIPNVSRLWLPRIKTEHPLTREICETRNKLGPCGSEWRVG